jgi:hypothetical protein
MAESNMMAEFDEIVNTGNIDFDEIGILSDHLSNDRFAENTDEIESLDKMVKAKLTFFDEGGEFHVPALIQKNLYNQISELYLDSKEGDCRRNLMNKQKVVSLRDTQFILGNIPKGAYLGTNYINLKTKKGNNKHPKLYYIIPFNKDYDNTNDFNARSNKMVPMSELGHEAYNDAMNLLYGSYRSGVWSKEKLVESILNKD